MEERKELTQLEECLPLLLSGNRKKRLIGEYWEMKIRSAALKEEIERRTEEEHKWNESMEHHIMSRQLSDMLGYLSCLGLRATEKEIDLMDTELSEDEYFIRISGNKEMRQGWFSGYSDVCMRALLRTTAETASILKKEEIAMEEFIEETTTIFMAMLYEAAQEMEEKGCK